LRAREAVLQTGHAQYFAVNDDVLAILRFVVDQRDAFGAKAENKIMLMLVNPSEKTQKVTFDFRTKKEGVSRRLHHKMLETLKIPPFMQHWNR
jgi:hypothetical protein